MARPAALAPLPQQQSSAHTHRWKRWGGLVPLALRTSHGSGLAEEKLLAPSGLGEADCPVGGLATLTLLLEAMGGGGLLLSAKAR